ncbi:redoxin domain-containing protein [Flavobacteriales bacterium]|nr:redoxin domain-containing protein [Flavobacteriales bacterium]
MKALYTLLILFILTSNNSIAQINSPLELGSIIPMSKELMINVTDEKMSLDNNFNENGLLVVFSCNTCPFVVMWEDRYRQLEEMCQINKVGMVYINSNEAKRNGDDSKEEMKNYAKSMGYTFPYLIDQNSAVANAFGAKTTPHIYLFDENKKLVYKGAIDDNFRDISQVKETYLLDAIQQMVSGVDIKIKETNAKGCSIKREIN